MSTAIRFTCTSCSQTIKAQAGQAGRSARCPSCKKPVMVPQQSEVRPVSDEFPLAAMSIGDEVNLEELIENESPATPRPNRRPKPLQIDESSHGMAAYRSALTDYTNEAEVEAGNGDERRYPGLVRVRIALQVLAVLSVITWFMSLASYMLGLGPEVAAPDAATEESGSIFPFGFALRFLAGAITLCGLYAASELIQLMLDINERLQAVGKRKRA